jgi:hypothetical protein
MKNHGYASFVFGIVLAGLIALWLPDFLQHGNSRVIEAWGDGYKSYHAYRYHIRYDSTLTHFSGMNYPYGEHAIPGDTQPLLSNAVKLLMRLGLPADRYDYAIFHGALLLGLWLCGFFLWLIFRQLGLPALTAAAAAVGICFLSPQIERIAAHFGLGHPELIPLLSYLLLRFHRQPHWRWSLGVGVVVWAYSLLHFYFFAIAAFFIFGFMVLRWLYLREWSQTLHYLLHGSLQLLLPLLFFYFWLYHNDPISDRTREPWGFFVYKAIPEGIYSSMAQPHWQWFAANIRPLEAVGFEGKAYIGLAALLGTLGVLLGFLWKKKASGRQLAAGTDRGYLLPLGLSGGLILLFSLGMPFVWPGKESWLEWAGPIRQFRSIGRFAWVFFYTSNIVAITALYRWSLSGGLRPAVRTGLLLVLLLEAWYFSRSVDLRLDTIEEYADGSAFTDIDSLDFGRYQAILPVPYYNIGSDNYWWQLSGFIGQKTQTLSMQTGLPLTGAMLTRTSLGQTVNQLQLVLEPYRRPAILSDMPSDKPLLMAWDEERLQGQRHRYEHLLEGARLVYSKPPLFLYELPLDSYQQRISRRLDSLQLLAADTSLTAKKDGWKCTDSNAVYIYESFDREPQARSYRGGGALRARMADETVALEAALTGLDSLQPLTFSVWMWLLADRHPRTDMILLELDPVGGAERARHQLQTREAVVTFDNNGWGLLEWTVNPLATDSRWKWIFTNPALRDESLWLDELLVRPASLNLLHVSPDTIGYNNRWWPVTD